MIDTSLGDELVMSSLEADTVAGRTCVAAAVDILEVGMDDGTRTLT